MARNSFPAALKLVLEHEGGYADHPLDPGGATNRGITQATLAAHRGQPVSKADVMALSVAEASSIYRASYWNAIRGDDLPPGVDLVVFDAAVNSGPARAARWLHAALGLPPESRIGSRVIEAASVQVSRDLIAAYSRQRLGFLKRLGTWTTFGRGWSRRVKATEIAALGMTGPPRSPNPRGRTTEKAPMTDSKSLLTSKTLWSNLIGLSAVFLSLFGINTSGVDSAGLSEAIPQVVAGLSFIASTVFRITATKRIAVM